MRDLPYVPAALPPQLMRLCSRLSRRNTALSVRLGDKTFRLDTDIAAVETLAAAGPAPPPDELSLPLLVDEECWMFQVHGPAADALLAPPEGLNPEDIPEELRPALSLLSLEPLLDQVSAALSRKVVPAAAAAVGPAVPTFILPFTLSLVQAKGTATPAGGGTARIPFSRKALALLSDAAKQLPPRPRPDITALPAFLSLSAGRESFPLSLLRAVEPGDVLLFEARARQAGALTLEWSSHALWTADLADGTVTLGNAVHRPDIQEISMDNTRQAAASPSPPRQAATPEAASGKGLSAAEIDALELPLTLELAEIRLTIGELTALAPGHTLQTDASLDAPITLKIRGRAVGRGRLVEVGDRLGVLVSSLSLDGADDLAARADVGSNTTRADAGNNTTRADAGSSTTRADVGNNTASGSGQ